VRPRRVILVDPVTQREIDPRTGHAVPAPALSLGTFLAIVLLVVFVLVAVV
jgi:hypothetical protein